MCIETCDNINIEVKFTKIQPCGDILSDEKPVARKSRAAPSIEATMCTSKVPWAGPPTESRSAVWPSSVSNKQDSSRPAQRRAGWRLLDRRDQRQPRTRACNWGTNGPRQRSLADQRWGVFVNRDS